MSEPSRALSFNGTGGCKEVLFSKRKMIHLIKTDGKIEKIKPKKGTIFTCEEVRDIVGDPVKTLLTKKEFIYLNEKGKQRGLPLNGKASVAVGLKFPHIHEIYGNVIIVDR